MAGVNKVMLVGNLGRDPEIKTMSNGNLVANLSIATSETWKDKATGERQERTEWHRVVIFNEGLVKVAEQYLAKGSTVYIEGQLQTRKYGPEGAEKYTTEIVLQKYKGELTMLGSRTSSNGNSYDAESGNSYLQAKQGSSTTINEDLNDEIPF